MASALIKSTFVVSFMTFLSRISGLVRDIVMANVLGSSALADAFFVAFRIPNFLRRIFAEGAFSQAFVPVFAELTERNTQHARQFVQASSGCLALATLLLSVLGMVFAEWLVLLLAPGYQADPAKFANTSEALRIMFPYLFCISLMAMSAGILNTLNRFALPAATPILLNVCLIVAMWGLVPVLDNAAKALAVGVMVAGLLQLLIQFPALKRHGFLLLPSFDWRNHHVMRVAKLMLPAIFSVSVAQVNLVVNTVLASFLVTGSISWLYYSDRLMEFPVGVFGIALATVVLPSLSKEHAAGSAEHFAKMLDWAIRWVVLIAAPAAVALFILATPLLATMFNYNQFSVDDVEQSALALRAFALGVVGFILVKVLAPGFFARQDTTTPMRIAIVSMLVNVLFSLILVGSLKHTGLALAISIAAWVNAGLLALVLWRRRVLRLQPGWLKFSLQVTLAIVAMSVLLQWLMAPSEDWYRWSAGQRAWALTQLVSMGAVAYFGVLLLLGLKPQAMLLRR